MELTLLSGHEGRWTGYRLEPIIKETAVIWDEEIRQFSADAYFHAGQCPNAQAQGFKQPV